eukprot:583223-Rhodomonas_salina.2
MEAIEGGCMRGEDADKCERVHARSFGSGLMEARRGDGMRHRLRVLAALVAVEVGAGIWGSSGGIDSRARCKASERGRMRRSEQERRRASGACAACADTLERRSIGSA